MLDFSLSIINVNCQALNLKLFLILSTTLENAAQEDTNAKNVKVTVMMTMIVKVILFVTSVVVLIVCQDVVAKGDHGMSLEKMFVSNQMH